MGLFDPPHVNIRKRVPQHALVAFAAIESFAAMKLEDLKPKQQACALAVVLSAWTCNSALTGAFQLSQFNFNLTQNAETNCFNVLSPKNQQRTIAILEELEAKGLLQSASVSDDDSN